MIHRKVSLGTQSETGERFAERALSAAVTCRMQRRSLFTYLSELSPRTPAVIHSPRSPEPRGLNAYGKPFVCGAFLEAAEGTRTLDLLHGKQTL